MSKKGSYMLVHLLVFTYKEENLAGRRYEARLTCPAHLRDVIVNRYIRHHRDYRLEDERTAEIPTKVLKKAARKTFVLAQREVFSQQIGEYFGGEKAGAIVDCAQRIPKP